MSPAVVYLLAVLLVAMYWGLAFGLLTSLASAGAFNFFHIPPTGRLVIADSAHWVALGVFFVAAAVASAVANLARTRAAEAERRRREADLAADTARELLGGATLADALAPASRLVSTALGVPGAAIVLDPGSDAAREGGVRLDLGDGREALLVLGAGAGDDVFARVRERVAPALEALLARRLTATACSGGRRDAGPAALGRHQDRTVAGGLTRPAHPPHRDHHAGHGCARRARGRRSAMSSARRRRGGATPFGACRPAARFVPAGGRCGGATARLVRARRGRRTAGSTSAPGTRPGFAPSSDARLPLVRADAAQLERVFVNLLDNAVRFFGRRPVEVRAPIGGGRASVAVSVSDHSTGMAPPPTSRTSLSHSGVHGGEHAGGPTPALVSD